MKKKYTLPKNWSKVRKEVFDMYNGKYCIKVGHHEGKVQVHHYVPLYTVKYDSEYYFVNEPWNLTPLCNRHHRKKHKHTGYVRVDDSKYVPEVYGKPKVSWAKRFFWTLKRGWYRHKFEKRYDEDSDYKILYFWNYTKWGTKRRKTKSEKYFDSLLR